MLTYILDSLPSARMQVFCFGDNGVPTPFTRAGWREVAHWRSIDPERSWTTHRLWGGYQATPHTDPAAGRARAPVKHHPLHGGNPTACCPAANAALRPKGHKAPSSIRDAANRPAATSVSTPQGSGWSATCRGTGCWHHFMDSHQQSWRMVDHPIYRLCQRGDWVRQYSLAGIGKARKIRGMWQKLIITLQICVDQRWSLQAKQDLHLGYTYSAVGEGLDELCTVQRRLWATVLYLLTAVDGNSG